MNNLEVVTEVTTDINQSETVNTVAYTSPSQPLYEVDDAPATLLKQLHKPRGKKIGESKYPFAEMKVKQMFFMPFDSMSVNRAYTLCRSRNKAEERMKSGRSFTAKRYDKEMPDGTIVAGTAIIRVK